MKKHKFSPDVEKLISSGFTPENALRYDFLNKSLRTDFALINALLLGSKPYSSESVKSICDCFARLSSSVSEMSEMDAVRIVSSVRSRIQDEGIEL